jgi:hypothetical protein
VSRSGSVQTVSGLSLAAYLPVLFIVVGALLGCLLSWPARSIGAAGLAWGVAAGVAGGTLVTHGLAAELVTVGAGGHALGGLAAALTAAGLTALLKQTHPGEEPVEKSAASVRTGRTIIGRRSLGLLGAAAALSLLLAALGAGLAAVVLLIAVAAVPLGAAGLGFAGGFVVAAAAVSAGEVVLGRLVLAPLGVAARPVPVVLVTLAVLLPLLAAATDPAPWRRAARGLGVVDVAVLALAVIAVRGWLSLFAGFDDAERLSQLLVLGEDNVVHALLLQIVDTSGATPADPGSRAAAGRFAEYFTGPSLWQGALGSLLSGGPADVSTYVATTAALLGLLVAAVVAAATGVAGRASLLTAVGVLTVGAITIRLVLAFFEYGFPGQLLVAFLLVAAFVLLRARPVSLLVRAWSGVALAVSTLAVAWSWSLAAPVLAVALAIWVATELVRSGHVSATLLTGLGLAAGVLACLMAVMLRARVLAALDTLTLEGAVYRAVPFWLAYLLVLALPVAGIVRRRQVPPAASALVLATMAASGFLVAWQVARTGGPTYYGFKLQNLLVLLGLACTAMLVAAVVARWERELGGTQVVVVGVALAMVTAPLWLWPVDSYRSWLTQRAVLGSDPTLVCALEQADTLPPDVVVLAAGYGDALTDTLITKAISVPLGAATSGPFWNAILNQPDPALWPWPGPGTDVAVVPGPKPGDRVPRVVAAAQATGADVSVLQACGPPAGQS